MSEITTYALDCKEIITAIIKSQDLHDGIWQLHIEFGLGATNMQIGENEVAPVALVPIKKIGITKVDKENPIAIDASKVNPAPTKSKKKEKAK